MGSPPRPKSLLLGGWTHSASCPWSTVLGQKGEREEGQPLFSHQLKDEEMGPSSFFWLRIRARLCLVLLGLQQLEVLSHMPESSKAFFRSQAPSWNSGFWWGGGQ